MKGGDTEIALFVFFIYDTLSCVYKINLLLNQKEKDEKHVFL